MKQPRSDQAVNAMSKADELSKDFTLNQLATIANVAQFVSFSPSLQQRYARVRGFAANHQFPSLGAAISSLLASSNGHSVNVRSFKSGADKGAEFIYGLTIPADVTAALQRLSGQGFYTIVNETIDVNDGGVSGVLCGGLMEWAPGDTPRCVEGPDIVSTRSEFGLNLLGTVYGFKPEIQLGSTRRVEFSVHPIRRGFLHEHTIIWESEEVAALDLDAPTVWPNRFSRLIGDKVFGLLVADALGWKVPKTTAIPRRIAPFSFGRPTGTGEVWLRTCPSERTPGKFSTTFGWSDPFRIISVEDSAGEMIASVMAQEAIEPCYSGSLVSHTNGSALIEGVKGKGDRFMVSKQSPETLPSGVESAVKALYDEVKTRLGPAGFEWVFDGTSVWIVQLHLGSSRSSRRVIYPGRAENYIRFAASEGIEALRELISKIQGTRTGVIVLGNIGVTSHAGDLLRRAKVPSRIEFL